jgi:uncharacterized membrane protein YkvA (DUF1232 family)
MPDVLFTYGYVRDFLVVGIGENSFEKLIDTYRKKIVVHSKKRTVFKSFQKV